ncbi:MAG TPA: hypothetical protein VE396_08830 [Xanthobacteraceae bacterium]|nr:hypothetical protein [Xanthobacteraceae bacterium]
MITKIFTEPIFCQEPSGIDRVRGRGTKGRGPIVKGFPRRFGNFSLRDLLLSGAFRRGRTEHRRRKRSRADRPGEAFSRPDHPAPDRHVLDYRVLDSVRLGLGEFYADS